MQQEIDYFDQEKPIGDVTMQELDLLGQAIFKLKKEIEEQERFIDGRKETLNKMQGKMLSILERFGRTNYAIPGEGMLIKTERLTVTLPKTPEDRESFFKYLRDKGLFEDLVTVNSQTLNAFYKKEFEAAAQEGRAVGFKIPGISEPKTVVNLNVRKGK